MDLSKDFLPIFDVPKIEKYFFNDYTSIVSFFQITSENLHTDLSHVASAYGKKDLSALKNAIHTIKPIFAIIGLPVIQEEVDKFYMHCNKCSTIRGLKKPYHQLWANLQLAKDVITAQHIIFEQNGVSKDPFFDTKGNLLRTSVK